MGFFSSVKKLLGKGTSDSSSKDNFESNKSIETSPNLADSNNTLNLKDSFTDQTDYNSLTVSLRDVKPSLSNWLNVVLSGVDTKGPLFCNRLGFFLKSLDISSEESDKFIADLTKWLDAMDYHNLSDFRSELQYRLALALELEDEEDERSRLILKVSEGLSKTREQISKNLNSLLGTGRSLDDSFWEELEEVLLMADVGYETASKITSEVKNKAIARGITDSSDVRELLSAQILSLFPKVTRISGVNPPEVILVIGVNGVGKTTTIAKLAYRAKSQGKSVLLVAGDTFRAAAVEQLEVWSKRMDAGFYAKEHGSDPAAVAFEALELGLSKNYDTVFVDTAGRLHTKTNLMEELKKVRRVLAKVHPGAPHRTILVIDATTGQNGLNQIKQFNESCPIDELVITKLDGTAKGGIAVAAASQFGIPISFVGLGEKMEDLRPFDSSSFVNALLN